MGFLQLRIRRIFRVRSGFTFYRLKETNGKHAAYVALK